MAIVKTDSQHYADIAAAIRSKAGTAQHYKPREMSTAILGLEGGSLESAIIVYADPGSEITLTCGGVVRTVPENGGVWRFDNCPLGSYTVTASKGGMTKVYPVEITEKGQLMRYEVQVFYVRYFGVMRDITSTSPAWTRTEMAVGLQATASTSLETGSSDFDAFYPWSEIGRETLSTGDVMVKIPKFWYKRYREGNVEHLIIADMPVDGYKLHPAFYHAGVERDAVYVGAYKVAADGRSVPGGLPKATTTRGNFRTMAAGKGAGWQLMDVSTLSALQMLYLVEYATFDCQSAIGKGYVGANQYGGSGIAMGSTDTVANLTGVPFGEQGKVDVIWRGMEGLWSNILEFVDGLNLDCGNKVYYVCNNPAQYADDTKINYTPLNYLIPSVDANGAYIKTLGFDPVNDHIMFPAEIGGSGSTYVCDTVALSVSSGTIAVAQYGGRWYSQEKAGLFKLDGTIAYTTSRAYIGARMIYIPQEGNV